MKLKRKFSLISILATVFFFLLSANALFAGSTGKIAGRVTDKGTGDGLPGPNIEILGTTMGATTDMDGTFIIINVPPGTYTLRISMIGYKTVNIEDVRVFIDRTAKVSAKLEETVLEGEAVTVVAEREAVEFDRTNTASYVGQEEIEAMPVATVSDIIKLQAGVITDAGGGLHFRGGRTREVAYMIDGVPVSNNFSQGGGSNVALENNFIKELQVITGTFNAEYGSAQSGIINVVTKVPENKYNGNIELRSGGFYAPNKPQFIGLDSYDPLSEKELRFSLSGPLPFFKKLGKLGFFLNGRLVNNDGWLNGQRRFMPEDGWEIEVYREWYRATYDPEDPLVIPIPDSMHTGDGKIMPINWSKKYNVNAKLVYQPMATLTLSYNMFLNRSNGKSYSYSWRFTPDGLPYWWSNNATHMLVITHSPLKNLFYNIRYSYQENHSKSYMYENASDPRYQTTSVNAWDPGAITGFDYGGIESWNRRWQDRTLQLGNGDVTWQINNFLEVKTGLEVKYHNLHYRNAPMRERLGYESQQFPFTRNEIRGLEIPYDYFKNKTADYEFGTIKLRETRPDSTIDDLFFVDYERKPVEASSYLQTKLSMGDIILNAGVRFDYFRPNDRYAPDYTKVFPEFVGDDRYYVQAKSKYQISPRFGLSFPISSRGAMRVSYGHFFQAPSFEKMYQNPVLRNYNQFSIANTKIGNPNLKPEKTVQYEIGLQQELAPGLSTELTVFYKDIRDLLGLEILTLSNATTFWRYINKEYGNSSGITLAFNQRLMNGLLTANIDYTYMVAKGTSSSPEAARDVSILSGSGRGAYTIATRRIDFLGWDQTHSLNAAVSLRPSKSLYLSLIGQLGSGLPYSPATLDPSIEIPGGWWDNAGRKPLRWNVDLKLFKSVNLFGTNFGAFFNIYNLFNHLNENYVNAITGHAGPRAYLPEISKKRYERLAEIGTFSRDEADYNPTHYSQPRLIQFGASFQF